LPLQGSDLSKLFEELKRRNVIRVGIAYLVAAWVVLQVARDQSEQRQRQQLACE
jgi:hypothetical protein